MSSSSGATSRRRFLGTLACASAGMLVAGCGGINPARLGRDADGFAAVNQEPVVAVGPVGANLPESPTIARVRAAGVLRWAGSSSLPGFSQVNPTTGKLTGFDTGIAELWAKYLLGEPNVEFSEGGADTREAFLQNHTVDSVIATYSMTANRERVVNFAGPYLTVTSGVAVQNGDPTIRRSVDLTGRLVAVQPGAAEESLLAEVPEAAPVRFQENSQCLSALQQGRVQAWVANTAILTSRVGTDSRTRLTDIAFGRSRFGIGLPKDDPVVKEVGNQFINEISRSGLWQRLWDSTAGVVDKVSRPQPPRV